VKLDPEYAALLETGIDQDLRVPREEAERERNLAIRKLRRLSGQRRKLLEAHYENAVPIDLLRSEQQRIGEEMDRVEERLGGADMTYETIMGLLQRCLAFLGDCEQTYLDAPPEERRQLNQGMFEKFYVTEDGVVGAELAAPFGILLQPHLLVAPEDSPDDERVGTDAVVLSNRHRDDWSEGLALLDAQRRLVGAGPNATSSGTWTRGQAAERETPRPRFLRPGCEHELRGTPDGTSFQTSTRDLGVTLHRR
jgi:hypothetical protein